MKRFLFSTLVLVFTTVICAAQKTESSEIQSPQNIILNKVISKNWKLPINEEKEKQGTGKGMIDNYPVETRYYKLPKPFDMRWDIYSFRANDNALVTTYNDVEVRGFLEIIAEKKTFAYRVEAIPFGINQHGGKSYAGAILTAYYVDEDGDGTFETYYINKMPDKIPDWIPKDADKIIKPLQKPPEWKSPSGNFQ